MNDPLRKLALRDGRYTPEAYAFLFESLDNAVRLAGREAAEGVDRHVTGQELLAGLRQHASELFGPLAAEVWRLRRRIPAAAAARALPASGRRAQGELR